MIRTGMPLNMNCLWEESQLSDKLQIIVGRHRNNFDAEKVITCAAGIETDSDSEEEE